MSQQSRAYNRDKSVTYAKALAIILMVLGHACVKTYIETFVNMFHVTLFFFVSGYCFKTEYLNSSFFFLKKKTFAIYYPYVKWSLVFILFHNLFVNTGIYNFEFSGKIAQLYNWDDYLYHIAKAFTLVGTERLLGGYWFLSSFFVATIITFFVIRFFRKRLYLNVLVLSLLSFTLNLISFNILAIGYRSLMNAVFILLGFIYRDSGIQIHKNVLCIIGSVLLIILGSFLWPGSAGGVNFENQIPFMAASIMGSIGVLGGAYYVQKNMFGRLDRLICFIGDNTLTILTWHFMFFIIISVIICYYYNLPYSRIAEFPVIKEYSSSGWAIVYVVAGVIFPLVLAYLNRFVKSKWLKL